MTYWIGMSRIEMEKYIGRYNKKPGKRTCMKNCNGLGKKGYDGIWCVETSELM